MPDDFPDKELAGKHGYLWSVKIKKILSGQLPSLR